MAFHERNPGVDGGQAVILRHRVSLPLTKSRAEGVRDTEVDERGTPIGAATGVPSGSGAFAGHALSRRDRPRNPRRL